MEFDFAAILLGLTVLFGVVWGLDRLFLYKKRKARLDAAGEEYRDPAPVDWARSLFPVVLVVLVLRSFVAEPFRIPSGSMMPTLEDRKSTRLNSSHMSISYAVFCLKKKKK